MVRILHAADFHLDSAFTGLNEQQARQRRQESRDLTRRMVEYANDHGVQLMLLAGDLFDSDCVTRDTCELLAGQFASFPTCRFFISPGNHDPYNDASVYKRMEWPDNVHIFTGEKERVRLDELGVDVYGVGFTGKTCLSSPVVGYPALDKSRLNILVCHGEVGVPLSANGPITKAEIAQSGFDYIALGHIHAPSGLLREGDTQYAYPGCLESRSFDEPGYHGALFGELSKESNGLRFVRFSKRRYERTVVDIGGCADKIEAVERIRAGIRRYTEDTALRLTLTGEVADSFLITPADIGRGCEYPWHIEIIDKTLPTPDYLALERESTLRGVFYSKMKACIEAAEPDSEDYIIALNALKYGLGALNDRSINDFGGEG